MENLVEWMYERLPALARVRDESLEARTLDPDSLLEKVTPGPLYQLFSVLGVGLDLVKGLADESINLIDVETTPVEHLPFLAGLLGFEFPHDLPEEQQRNFVRSAVSLYRVKGTPSALKFVVQRIIGGGFLIEITDEDREAKTFTVRLSADENTVLLDALQDKTVYLVNLYSPAGMIPTVVIAYVATERLDNSTQTDAQHHTVAYTRWSFNIPGHAFNSWKNPTSVVSFNNLGQQTLSI